MLKKTEKKVRESDVLRALAAHQNVLDQIPSRQTRVRINGTEQNIFVSIIAPDIGFEWSVIVPRELAAFSREPMVAMELALYSLRDAIEQSFPSRC